MGPRPLGQQLNQRERRLHRAGAWVTGPFLPKDAKKRSLLFIYRKISQYLPISLNHSYSLFHLFPFSRLRELPTSSYQWASSFLSKVRFCPYLSSFPNFMWVSTNPAQTDFVSSCTPLSSWTESLRVMQILRLILDSLSGHPLGTPLLALPLPYEPTED